MLYYSYTLMFSLVLQHCCYVVVRRFFRSLMAFVCQEIKGLLTYLLTYLIVTPSCQYRPQQLTYEPATYRPGSNYHNRLECHPEIVKFDLRTTALPILPVFAFYKP